MSSYLFELSLLDWSWINGTKDDADDLCLHGKVFARAGNDVIADSYDCTISATGLYLLRSIEKDHTPECEHMFPCCGQFMIPADNLSTVQICGCPNGIQLLVSHNDDKVEFISETTTGVLITLAEYKNTVYPFIQDIERIYKDYPRRLPQDGFSRNGYLAFWNEWHSLKRRFFNEV